MANEWREHAMLKGRFLPDYPDDLQVIIHDGGPQITRNEPEVVWVTVTGSDGNLFWGRVHNQPDNLETVRRGDEIKFVMPENDAPQDLLERAARRLGLHQSPRTGWLAPILVTDKYLSERNVWVIHPCRQCGLSELFDAPSDLLRVLSLHSPPDVGGSRFTVPCPQCGGRLCIESRRAPAAGGAEPAAADSNPEGTYLDIVKSQVENMTAIGSLLASIADEASADVVLTELDKAIARHNDLSARIESYERDMEDHENLAQEQYQEYLATYSDLTVSSAVAQSNAALAQSKAPNRASEIEAAMKKIGLA